MNTDADTYTEGGRETHTQTDTIPRAHHSCVLARYYQEVGAQLLEDLEVRVRDLVCFLQRWMSEAAQRSQACLINVASPGKCTNTVRVCHDSQRTHDGEGRQDGVLLLGRNPQVSLPFV